MQLQTAIYNGAGEERDSRDPGRGNKHPVTKHSSQNNHSQKLRLSTVREKSREVPQWGARREYHPGGENKINKEQGEGGKREKEKKREGNKQANEPGRTPSLSHDCSLHWRLARYGFSSETWKALSMCMLRGQRLHASRDRVNLNLASISYGTTKTCGQFLRFCLNGALVRSQTFCLGV